MRGAAVDSAEQPTGLVLHDLHCLATGRSDVDGIHSALPARPEPAMRSLAEQTLPDELRDHGWRRTAEDLVVIGGEWQLLRGGTQLRTQDIRVLRVEDRRLDRASEDGGRMADQVGVQRVVAGHQQGQGVPTGSAGTPCLLP